jgi:hypothetical protein
MSRCQTQTAPCINGVTSFLLYGFKMKFPQKKFYFNFDDLAKNQQKDGFVKSRHSGENRSPGRL